MMPKSVSGYTLTHTAGRLRADAAILGSCLILSSLARLALFVEQGLTARETALSLLRHVRIEGSLLLAAFGFLAALRFAAGRFQSHGLARRFAGALAFTVLAIPLATALLYVVDLPVYRGFRLHLDQRFLWYAGELGQIGDMLWKEAHFHPTEWTLLGLWLVTIGLAPLAAPLQSRLAARIGERRLARAFAGAGAAIVAYLAVAHALHVADIVRTPKAFIHLSDNLLIRFVRVAHQTRDLRNYPTPEPGDRDKVLSWLGVESVQVAGEGILHTPAGVASRIRGRYKTYNLVFLILEGVRAREIGALWDRSGPSPTPFLDQLAQRGVLFSRFYASSVQTIRGLVSSFCSTPDFHGERLLKIAPHTRLTCLPELLIARGYDTAFVYGGDISYDNMYAFFSRQGIRRFSGYESFPRSAPRFSWGVHDEATLGAFAGVLDGLNEPFVGITLTLSNHSPYEAPAPFRVDAESIEERYRSTVRYTDDTLRRFFERVRERPFFRHTLFAIFADHGMSFDAEGAGVLAGLGEENMRIPFLLYAGDESLQATPDDTLGGQIDIAPTLADLLGLETDTPWWGRSLLTSASDRFAYFSTPFGEAPIALVEADRKLTYTFGTDEYRTTFTGGFSEEPVTDAEEAIAPMRDRLWTIYRLSNYLLATNRLTEP